MKQYTLTSSDFVTPGDTGVPDAVIDLDELNSAEASRSKLVDFMQKQIANRLTTNNEPEHLVTIELRERKYE